MDESTAAVTVSTSAGLTIAPRVAVMFEVPTATPVASPAAEMVATLVVPDFQVTVAVMSACDASL